MPSIYSQLDIPPENSPISITPAEGEFIHDFLKERKIQKTLETGLAFGCAAAHIISATRHRHYAMDPHQKKFDDRGLKNIQKLDLAKHLVFEYNFSHCVLPKLLQEGVDLDFVFIDGGHKFDEIFIDYYYADLLLNPNGYILFHDLWMRSTQHVLSWIRHNKKNYRFIPVPADNMAMVQKTGPDGRAWHHFSGFGTLKSFFLQARLKFIDRIDRTSNDAPMTSHE
ncbi:MAG TPA: class I SAM-dependent methyltransferase [Elusimicrobiota bacterium]|nr:class I SAM-dependent methyltransferase [Elusimicrobiota bacterium]